MSDLERAIELLKAGVIAYSSHDTDQMHDWSMKAQEFVRETQGRPA
jgi:hypothetical protein